MDDNAEETHIQKVQPESFHQNIENPVTNHEKLPASNALLGAQSTSTVFDTPIIQKPSNTSTSPAASIFSEKATYANEDIAQE